MAESGLLLIVSGPSGVGKTTIARKIEQQIGGVFSISMTTRPQGPHDRDGVDYHFVEQAKFEQMRTADQMLEWAQVFGNCYGTPKQPVVDALSNGQLMILEIDVKGARRVKAEMPEAFAMFLLPPSEEVLLDRLRKRKREDESAIQLRFSHSKEEIAHAKSSGVYGLFVVNNELDLAVEECVNVVKQKLRGGV